MYPAQNRCESMATTKHLINIFVVDLYPAASHFCTSIVEASQQLVPCVAWTIYKLSRLQVTLLTNTHIGKCCKLAYSFCLA